MRARVCVCAHACVSAVLIVNRNLERYWHRWRVPWWICGAWITINRFTIHLSFTWHIPTCTIIDQNLYVYYHLKIFQYLCLSIYDSFNFFFFCACKRTVNILMYVCARVRIRMCTQNTHKHYTEFNKRFKLEYEFEFYTLEIIWSFGSTALWYQERASG